MQAVALESDASQMPMDATGLRLSRKGVMVTAFGSNPDGSGTLLRLWEMAGQSGPCQVALPTGLKVRAVQPVDLRGRNRGQPLGVTEDGFEFNLAAFAPASFVLLP